MLVTNWVFAGRLQSEALTSAACGDVGKKKLLDRSVIQLQSNPVRGIHQNVALVFISDK